MRLRTKLSVLLTAAALGISATAPAGIPVIDYTQAANMTQQLAHNLQQLTNLKRQLDQLRQQYRAMTGSRGMGNLYTTVGLSSVLPSDWQKVYAAIQTGGIEGLSEGAKAIVEATGMNERCKSYQEGSRQRKACETTAVQSAQNQFYITKALDATSRRLDNLISIAGQIDGTKDIKAIQDLTARIAVEQAAINNEGNRLQLFFRMMDEQEKNAAIQEQNDERQRQRELDRQALRRKL